MSLCENLYQSWLDRHGKISHNDLIRHWLKVHAYRLEDWSKMIDELRSKEKYSFSICMLPLGI